MKEIEIRSSDVALYKILKFEGLVESGGRAKAVIDEGLVSVNGATELRKRKKVVAGDVVTFMDETFRIVSAV